METHQNIRRRSCIRSTGKDETEEVAEPQRKHFTHNEKRGFLQRIIPKTDKDNNNNNNNNNAKKPNTNAKALPKAKSSSSTSESDD